VAGRVSRAAAQDLQRAGPRAGLSDLIIEAILLTHDAQLGLAELVHKTYALLWPGHPFIFRVPFANANASGAFSYLSAQGNCLMIESPASIKESMAVLLDGIDSSEWVLWCIDDRFPIRVAQAAATRLVEDLDKLPRDVEEVKLLHWREPLLAGRIVIGGRRFRRQAPGSRARGFWHHHFVRAGVLRAAFLGEDVARDCRIYAITERIKDREGLLFRGTVVVAARPLLGLGEPLVEGLLTSNGREWLERMQCDVPRYGSVDRHVEFR
jgi:hypothetical protein